MLNPDLPSTKTYEKHLTDMKFPLVFRICAQSSSRRFGNYGYSYDYEYFMGKSMYNRSLYGWNGHIRNGSTIASFQGIYLYECATLSLSYFTQ